jgi:carbohydrate kinase (thermoresistant glucokinase family)
MAAQSSVADRTTAIVVMGVSGAGKSTVGTRLAERLSRPLIEGDSLHPPQNIEKMSRGTPLDDSDRMPWLQAIAARIDDARQTREPIIVTCSALKRVYRATLTNGYADVCFVYLRGAKELIAQRLAARIDHFMPPALLDSQFAALQEPSDDEPTIVIPIDATPDDIVNAIVQRFGAEMRS